MTASSALEIGPSTIAAVGEEDPLLARFCDEVPHPFKEIKREREPKTGAGRASNPDTYNANGTVKKGSRAWHRSNRYRKRQERIAECQGKLGRSQKEGAGRIKQQNP